MTQVAPVVQEEQNQSETVAPYESEDDDDYLSIKEDWKHLE